MLAAEALLIQAVRNIDPQVSLPLVIQTKETGKPYFADIPLFFSLSHSGDYVACAVADYEIGLDIQCIRPLDERLVHRCFTPQEQSILRESKNPDNMFTTLWSIKESYLKATGQGLSGGLSSFSIAWGDTVRLVNQPKARFWLCGDDRYKLSLCALDGQIPQPDIIQFDD